MSGGNNSPDCPDGATIDNGNNCCPGGGGAPPNVFAVCPVGGEYATIQAAIDAAVAGGFGPEGVAPNGPAVVTVCPGVYPETLTGAPGIDVQSEDATAISGPSASGVSVFVRPPTGVPLTLDMSSGGGLLEDNASRYRGIAFQSADREGVLFTGVSAQLATFLDCQISSARNDGEALEISNTGIDGAGNPSRLQIIRCEVLNTGGTLAARVTAGHFIVAGPYTIQSSGIEAVEIAVAGFMAVVSSPGEIVGRTTILDGTQALFDHGALRASGVEPLRVVSPSVAIVFDTLFERNDLATDPIIDGDGILLWSGIEIQGTSRVIADTLSTIKQETAGPDLIVQPTYSGAGPKFIQAQWLQPTDSSANAVPIVLPPIGAAARHGTRVLIHDVGAAVIGAPLPFPVLITPAGADTIDGAASVSLTAGRQTIELTADPTTGEWYCTSECKPADGAGASRWEEPYCESLASLGGDPGVPLPPVLKMIVCVGRDSVPNPAPPPGTQSIVQTERDALAGRARTLARVALSVEAVAPFAPPPTFACRVQLKADTAPTTPASIIETVLDPAQPTSGASADYVFAAGAVAAGDLYAIEILGLDTIGPLPAGGRLNLRACFEWTD